MNSFEIRKKFLKFFANQDHQIIPSASLIPENDPTVLFTTAGMHPLVPFLMGEKHPAGRRLASIQPCIRTGDIDQVGDNVHHTFFEMLGNWSLGDYFKKEAIEFSFDFLTNKKWLNLDRNKMAVSVFAGDNDAPQDKETKKIWLSLGFPEERIKELTKKNNWWGPAGQTGPCGPDTEMFYWTGTEKAPKEFNPENSKWMEIWNNVFMEYFKNNQGKYKTLTQKNVDTGMGLERTLAVLNNLSDNYQTDVFLPIIKKIEELSGKKYDDYKKEFRIIADHLKAATFIIGDKYEIKPSNSGQGYVIRRLLRSSIRYGKKLGLPDKFLIKLIPKIVEIYGETYSYIKERENYIINIIDHEEEKFEKTLEKGLKEFEKGKNAFILYTTYGFPIELTMEIAKEKGVFIDLEKFNNELKKHQELSRTASVGMFKGGLADSGEKAVCYHTATHLLLAALRQVLGSHVYQRGSNINVERLRFDFSHSNKMTEQQIKEVEEIVNQKIKDNIPIICQEMSLEEAKNKNIMGVFENKYGQRVKIYAIGNFSQEICGGPHAKKTSALGNFKIIKEESSSAGTRRIKAKLL